MSLCKEKHRSIYGRSLSQYQSRIVAEEGAILNFRTLAQFGWFIIITKTFQKQQKKLSFTKKLFLK